MTESEATIRVELEDAERTLLQAVDDMIEMLGPDHWGEHFRKCRKAIMSVKTWQSKNSAAAMIRQVYGGMGSFNDWYTEATCDRGSFVNVRDQLYLLSRIYENARFARYLVERDQGA